MADFKYRVNFEIIDNIDEVIRHFQQAVSRLGTGKEAGGQFGAYAQQAAGQVREIAARQQLPTGELARGLADLERIAKVQAQTASAPFRRGAREAGFYPTPTFKQPEGWGLERIAATQEKIGQARQKAMEGADVKAGLSVDPLYKQATIQAASARKRLAADVQAGLLGDERYQTATKDLLRARQQQAAKTSAAMLGDTQYQTATKELLRTRKQQQARTAGALLGDPEYQQATKNLAVTRQQQAAKTAASLLGEPIYQTATKNLAVTRQQQQARTQAALLGDTNYQRATRQLAVTRQQQQAKTQAALLGDSTYQTATRNLAVTRQTQQAKTAETLLGDAHYQGATRRLAVTRLQQESKTAGALLTDTAYQQATKNFAVTRQQQAAKTQAALLGDTDYQRATKDLAVTRTQQLVKSQGALLGDSQYQSAVKQLAVTRTQQQAKTSAALLADTDYQTASKRLAITRQQQQAKTQGTLLGDAEYQSATKRLAVGRQQQQAKMAAALLGDTDYQSATKNLAVTRQQQLAKSGGALLGDTDYQTATKNLAVTRQQQQAKTQGALLGDTDYQTATKNLAVTRQQQQARSQGALLGDTDYQSATKNLAVGRQQQQARMAAALLGDTDYQAATKNLAVTRQQQQARTQGALLGDTDYQSATKNLAVTRAQQQAKMQGALAGDDTYRQATVDLAVARRTQAARTDQALADDPLARAAGVQAAKAKELLAAQTAQAKVADPEYMAASKAAAVAKAKLAAETQQALAADPEYRQATIRAAAAKEAQAANLRAGLAADRQYIEATARLAMAREEQAARVALARQGETYTGTNRQELLARGALAQRTQADLQAAVTAREAMVGNQESVKAAALKSFNERQYAAAVHKAERELMRSSIKSGEAGGTWYQRLQARVSPSGKAPTEFATGKEAAVQKTITTGGYAVGGMIAGGLLYGAIEAVKAASELQEKLAGLKGQMEAIGEGRQFVTIREDIKEVSNETGKSSAEVATFYSRVLGLSEGPAQALQETESAMKLMTVAGIDMGTMIEEVVPITKAFGISMEELGNIAVGIRDRFGVAEESILHFLGETASTMRDAGFTAEEAAVVGQAAANAVGKSASVVGEQFAKVIGTIEEHQQEIINVYRRSPATAQLAEPIIQGFAEGDTAGVFKQMLASYDQLDDVQRQTLIRVAGSRKEWALLSGIFRNNNKTLQDLANAEELASRGGDKLNKRFEEVSATLNRTQERIKQLFANLVEGLVSSGVGTAINFIGQALEGLMKTANGLIAVFNRLNEATKFGPFDNGILMFLTEIAAGLFIAVKAWKLFSSTKAQAQRVDAILTGAERALSTQQGITTTTTIGESEALTLNAGVKEANAAATQGLAGTSGIANTAGLAGTRLAQTESGLIVPAGGVAGSGVASAAGARLGQQAAREATEEIGEGVVTGVTGAGAFATTKALFSKAGSAIKGLFSSGGLFDKAMYSEIGGAAATTAGVAGLAVAGYTAADFGRTSILEGTEGGMGGGPVGWVVRGAAGIGDQGLNKTVEENKAWLKQQNDATIEQLAEDHRNAWQRVTDKLTEAFFDVDLKDTLAGKERQQRIGATGAKDIELMRGQGQIGEFTKRISDQNITLLEDWMKQGGGYTDFAKDMGFTDAQGNVQLTREKLAQMLPEIEKRAKAGGDEGAARTAEFIHSILDAQSNLDDVKKKMADAVAHGSREQMDQAIDQAGGVEKWLSMIYDPKGALETGEITPSQYIDQLEQNIAITKQTLKGSKNEEAAVKGLNAKLLEGRKYMDSVIQGEVDRLSRFNAGSPTPKADEYNALIARLPRMTLQGQKQLIPTLFEKRKAKFEEELSQIQDPYDLYRRQVEGYQIEPELRSLDIQDVAGKSEADKPIFEKVLQQQEKGTTMPDMLKKYADIATQQGISVKDAMINDLKAKRKAFYDAGNQGPTVYDGMIAMLEAADLSDLDTPDRIEGDRRAADKALIASKQKAREADIALRRSTGPQGKRAQAAAELDVAQTRLDALLEAKSKGVGGPDIDADIKLAQASVNDAQRNSAEITKDVTEAMMQWEVVEANGNPVAETAAQLKIANYHAQRVLERTGDAKDPEYIEALQRVRELELQQAKNLAEIARSAFELQAFGRSRNALKAAGDQVTLALYAVYAATGDAERNQALLSWQQALRQLEDAQETILQSASQRAITLANIRQDPNEAALQRIKEAVRRLALGQKQELDEGQLSQLMDELDQARSDAVDTAVQEQEDVINFMLEMGQITQGQAIERLKVERDKYAVGTKKWRDLQLKIHSMEQSAQADLQFNLPTELALPTLYEARRLTQSTAMGAGYQDNRQNAIVINVNGAQDPAAVTNQVVAALQAAIGGGPVYSPQVGVGVG